MKKPARGRRHFGPQPPTRTWALSCGGAVTRQRALRSDPDAEDKILAHTDAELFKRFTRGLERKPKPEYEIVGIEPPQPN
jgi:hypothetical protein